jgi:SAM-dependent methyltransferase
MTHQHPGEEHPAFDRDYWEDRYRSAPALWSGRANPVLVQEVTDLPPGRALDAGCGEGGDALWLAAHGWQVTGVDISSVALERAAGAAAARGLQATWQQADLLEWTPPAAAFDLVCSFFVHVPGSDDPLLARRLATAVAPGGRLLVAGHEPSEMHPVERFGAHVFVSAEQLAEQLDPAQWEVEVAESRPRTQRDHDGREVALSDAVLRARRRP